MPTKGVGFTAHYYAWDTANNTGVTGDAANHTIYLSRDGTSDAADNAPAEVDSTNLPGLYSVALTATEADADVIVVAGSSSTADVEIIPTHYDMEPATQDANVTQLAGNTVQQTGGHIHAYDDAGNSLAVASVQPANAPTVDGSGHIEAIDTDGTAFNDLAQTDILSDGTPFDGANIDAAISSRSDFDETTDVVLASVEQILGTGLTESTGGNLAGAFETWYDVGTPANTVNSAPLGTAMRGTDGASTHDDPDPNGYISNLNGHVAQSGDTYAVLPTNFADLSITATDGYVTAGTVNDKSGYTISGTKTTLDDLNDITVQNIFDHTGFTASGTVAFSEVLQKVFAEARGRIVDNGDGTYDYYDDDDTTILFTLSLSDTERTNA